MEAPGATPVVDNQANADTCTAHALAKAVCGGFENNKFRPGYLDFNQSSIQYSFLCMNVFKSETHLLSFLVCRPTLNIEN